MAVIRSVLNTWKGRDRVTAAGYLFSSTQSTGSGPVAMALPRNKVTGSAESRPGLPQHTRSWPRPGLRLTCPPQTAGPLHPTLRSPRAAETWAQGSLGEGFHSKSHLWQIFKEQSSSNHGATSNPIPAPPGPLLLPLGGHLPARAPGDQASGRLCQASAGGDRSGDRIRDDRWSPPERGPSAHTGWHTFPCTVSASEAASVRAGGRGRKKALPALALRKTDAKAHGCPLPGRPLTRVTGPRGLGSGVPTRPLPACA